MDGNLDKRSTKLKSQLLNLTCSRHPAYKAEYFCRRRECGFGLLCRACEEIEHGILGHHDLDGVQVENIVGLARFLQDLFNTGLHYEELEKLLPNYTKEQLKKVNAERKRLTTRLEKELAELDSLIEKYQVDILAKIELRFRKLRKDLAEEMKAVYTKEVKPLDYISAAMENIVRKRDYSLERLLKDLENAHGDNGLDIDKCSMAIQAHLETTYNYLDINYMKDLRISLNYIDDPTQKINFDKQSLRDSLHQEILHGLEHIFDKITKVTRLDNGGLEPLLLSTAYADNLGKNISGSETTEYEGSLDAQVVDRKIKMGSTSPITALCKLGEKYVVLGHQNGILKMYLENVLLTEEFLDNMAPKCVYESGNIIHETSVCMMVCQNRAIDKNFLLCSSDISNRVSFSVLTEDLRIELTYKATQTHFGKIKKILPLGRSPFVATFAEGEPVKIWNTHERYLSLIINQFKVITDIDCILCDDSRYISLINAQGWYEMHSLDYNNNSKNVFSQPTSIKKRLVDAEPHKTSLVLECANRIELPFFSLLVQLPSSPSLQLHIFHFQTLETVSIRLCTIPSTLWNPFTRLDITHWKNVRELRKIDDWEEYYSHVKVGVYDGGRGEYGRIGVDGEGGLKVDMRVQSVGNFEGRPVMFLDLSAGRYPHVCYLVDRRLEYLGILGRDLVKKGQLFDENDPGNRLVLREKELIETESKPSLANGSVKSKPSSKKSGVTGSVQSSMKSKPALPKPKK